MRGFRGGKGKIGERRDKASGGHLTSKGKVPRSWREPRALEARQPSVPKEILSLSTGVRMIRNLLARQPENHTLE